MNNFEGSTNLKILSVGNLSGISNTCLHRHWALRKFTSNLDAVNTREKPISLWYKVAARLFNMGFRISLPDSSSANKEIIRFIKAAIDSPYDIVWIDKGITIDRRTLKFIKKLSPNTKIVAYSPDNMSLRHNQSQNFIDSVPFYDCHFTTKSFIIEDLYQLGCKKVYFTNKHYEESFHFERDITQEDIKRLGGDVGFIGAWEEERANSILYLVKNGIKVKVFGDGKWNDYQGVENLTILPGVYNEDYSKALQIFKISLCFLRKMNFDQQTSRSMEIPACGGFMLAERTDEHLKLFKEGIEAEFFSCNEELLRKCRYYLDNDLERNRVSAAGKDRCRISGYSNEESIKRMIKLVVNE